MPKKCNACGRFANATEGVKCNKCASFYHKACVNIPSSATVASGWLCPGCKVHTPRKDNTENPVRGESEDYVGTIQQPSPACGNCAELLKEMKLMNANILSMKNDFVNVKDDVSVLRNAVESFAGRLDGMELRFVSLEKKYAELKNAQASQVAGPEVSGLLATIDDLKAQLNDREQEGICNDFEISGIPEEQGERAAHLVSIISEKLGVSCDERDLVMVERTGVKRAPHDCVPAQMTRPRPLVVRLARRSLRDAFLQAARVRRNITTEGLGLSAAPTRFYVNERLSKYNKMLFFKTREEVHMNKWKYAWTRDGRIYVRRETGTASFRVRSEQDLGKIFGAASIAAPKS